MLLGSSSNRKCRLFFYLFSFETVKFFRITCLKQPSFSPIRVPHRLTLLQVWLSLCSPWLWLTCTRHQGPSGLYLHATLSRTRIVLLIPESHDWDLKDCSPSSPWLGVWDTWGHHPLGGTPRLHFITIVILDNYSCTIYKVCTNYLCFRERTYLVSLTSNLYANLWTLGIYIIYITICIYLQFIQYLYFN